MCESHRSFPAVDNFVGVLGHSAFHLILQQGKQVPPRVAAESLVADLADSNRPLQGLFGRRQRGVASDCDGSGRRALIRKAIDVDSGD